jgi:hypothetical protein
MVVEGQANALISRKDMTVNFLEGEEQEEAETINLIE